MAERPSAHTRQILVHKPEAACPGDPDVARGEEPVVRPGRARGAIYNGYACHTRERFGGEVKGKDGCWCEARAHTRVRACGRALASASMRTRALGRARARTRARTRARSLAYGRANLICAGVRTRCAGHTWEMVYARTAFENL